MDMPLSERRLIENEMIFRRANEKVARGIDKVNAQNESEGNYELMWDSAARLHFLCECADENCTERIRLRLKDYRKIHLNRNCFIIKPNHQVNAIEEVVSKARTHWVVKKNKSTTEPGKLLNVTAVDNS